MTNPVAEAIIARFGLAEAKVSTNMPTDALASAYSFDHGDYLCGLYYDTREPDGQQFMASIIHKPTGLRECKAGDDAEHTAHQAYWSLFQRIQAIVN